MTAFRWFGYVNYRDIPEYLRHGWYAPMPRTFDRLNHYGIVMEWLCDCKPWWPR